MQNRLQLIRKDRGLSQQKLGEMVGADKASVSRWETGTIPGYRIKELAQALRCSESDFFEEEEITIPILGTVGAGAEVFPIDDLPFITRDLKEPDWQGMNVETISVPPGFGRVAAVRVVGDSQYPAYLEGTLVFYQDRTTPPDELIGSWVICQLKSGAAYLKLLQKGSEYGRYNLESMNAAPMRNVEIDWCAKVEFFKQR